jgi:hypothetical protein
MQFFVHSGDEVFKRVLKHWRCIMARTKKVLKKRKCKTAHLFQTNLWYIQTIQLHQEKKTKKSPATKEMHSSILTQEVRGYVGEGQKVLSSYIFIFI